MVGNMGGMCMAAGLAVIQGQTDPGLRWNLTFRSMDLGSPKSTSAAGGLNPAGSGHAPGGEVGGSGNAEVRRKQEDESLLKAIYLSCWVQN